VDDYGHHPSEIRATLAAARSVGRKRVFVMFQPHRYSRTLALKDEFATAFGDADGVFVAEIYPASERPIPGVTGGTVAEAATAAGHKQAVYVPDRRQIPLAVGRLVKPGDLILSLGAGDIHEQGAVLASDLGRLEELAGVMGPGAAKLYEPMAKHTTLRVGGPAQFWLEPGTEAGFARLVRYCAKNGVPFLVIGRGSNLLVRDGGIRGAVIHPAKGEFERIEWRPDGAVEAGAGVKLKDLAYAARERGVGGFEWMEGIPGNVGGALRMNAGAMGAEMFGNVASVRYVDEEGETREVPGAELAPGYRSVEALRRNYAVSAVLRGEPQSREAIDALLAQSRAKRRTSQPAAASAGCIFKNPGPCPAGKLVDELGLKGVAVGGAKVSEVHGNFIVNAGGATAADVLELIGRVRERARADRGIELETEVQIVGEERSIHEIVA
jgi:UDP-N-acetylenolpyruvoylglucosamine reductase